MDYDYSNARFGIHECHCGVTGSLTEHSVVLFKKCFASFQRRRIFLHFLWPYASAACKISFCVMHVKNEQISLWSLVPQIYGKLITSYCLCLILLKRKNASFLLKKHQLYSDFSSPDILSWSRASVSISSNSYNTALIGLFYVSNMWQWDSCRDVDVLLWLNDFNLIDGENTELIKKST